MHLSTVFAVLETLAVVGSACNVYHYAPSELPALVCRQKGQLKKPRQFIRQYKTADYDTCSSNCQRDYNCNSIAYNTQTKICNIYYDSLKKTDFTVNKNSAWIFESYSCSTLTGLCPPANPSFDIVTQGQSHYTYDGPQDVKLQPWSDQEVGDLARDSYVQVATPNTAPAYVDPVPSGAYFALFTVANSSSEYLKQSYRLDKNTKYSISLNFAKISFDAVEQRQFSDYTLRITTADYDERLIGLWDLGVGGVNGQWYTVSTTFTTNEAFGLLSIGFRSPNFSDSSRLATFGLDGIQITPA